MIYVSVMGGISIGEPAADLPMALVIASAVSGTPLDSVAAWGEVALTGEVRSVDQSDRRRSESRRLGIDHILEAGDGRGLHDIFREVGVMKRIRTTERPSGDSNQGTRGAVMGITWEIVGLACVLDDTEIAPTTRCVATFRARDDDS